MLGHQLGNTIKAQLIPIKLRIERALVYLPYVHKRPDQGSGKETCNSKLADLSTHNKYNNHIQSYKHDTSLNHVSLQSLVFSFQIKEPWWEEKEREEARSVKFFYPVEPFRDSRRNTSISNSSHYFALFPFIPRDDVILCYW